MKKYIIAICLIILISGAAYGEDTSVIKSIQDAYELYSVGNYDEAAPLFEKAFKSASRSYKKDILGLFKLAVYTGLSYRNLEDYQNAYIWFEKAYSIAEQMQDKAVEASILAYMGEAERLEGNYDKAISFYLKAIDNEFISEKDRSVLYFGLAESYRLSQDYAKAKNACDMASKLSGGFSMEQLKLSCDIIKGETFRTSGDYGSALQSFGLVLDISRARQYADLTVAALNGMGLTEEALNRKSSARSNFEEALFTSLKNEMYDNTEVIIDKLITLMPKGHFSKKAKKLTDILDNNEIPDPFVKSALWRMAAVYYKSSGDMDNALNAAQSAYNEAAAAADGQPETVEALYTIADVLFASEKYYGAAVKLDKAIPIAKSSNYQNMGQLYALKAECFAAMEKYGDAYVLMKEAVKYDSSFEPRLSQLDNMTSGEPNSEKTGDPDEITLDPSQTPQDENDGDTIKTDETPVG